LKFTEVLVVIEMAKSGRRRSVSTRERSARFGPSVKRSTRLNSIDWMVTSRGWNILAATRNLLSRYQQTSPSV
ncbi:unnamed protein product, partial [Musa acuminata var. zebrina]